MDVLSLPEDPRPERAEEFLREIHEQPSASIRIPAKFDAASAAGTAVQQALSLATWAARGQAPHRLRLPIGVRSIEELRELTFVSSLPGMAALYFADVVDSDIASHTRNEALHAVAPRVAAMQAEDFEKTTSGNAVLLCCFSGAKNEFLRPLYFKEEPGRVRESSDFRILVKRLLRQLGPRVVQFVPEGQFAFISSLIHQLFLNCDEHGSYSGTGERLRRGIRGISARLVEIQDTQSFKSDKQFQAYLASVQLTPLRSRETQTGRISLVELSVFDTGPGLALHWLAQKRGCTSYADFTIDEEIDAIRTCFQKHATTKASSFSGQGLSMALQLMRELNAFLAIRTGRVSLCQDLTLQRAVEFRPVNRFPESELAEIVGTSYSITFRVD